MGFPGGAGTWHQLRDPLAGSPLGAKIPGHKLTQLSGRGARQRRRAGGWRKCSQTCSCRTGEKGDMEGTCWEREQAPPQSLAVPTHPPQHPTRLGTGQPQPNEPLCWPGRQRVGAGLGMGHGDNPDRQNSQPSSRVWDSPRARGQGWPGHPQGDTYSLRRLGSPWKMLALRQPMRLLERSLQGKRRGLRAGDTLLSPGWSRGLLKGLHQHLQMLQLGEAKEGAWLDRADQVVLQVPTGRQTQSSGCAAGSPVRRRPVQWGRGTSPHLPPTDSSAAPGPAKPPARASLAAFRPISLSLSLRRAQGRREAPRRSRG